MSLATPMHPSRSLQTLKTILFILAGLVLLIGLIGGISLVAGAQRWVVNALQMPLALMSGEIVFNLIEPMLTAFLINLGVAVLVVSLITSVLLYALGRLIGHTLLLEERIARLEAGR